MSTLYRKEYKGSTYRDEKLKLLCDIRHQYTNYDKLSTFYSIYPEKRTALNVAIGNLIKKGPDGITKFRNEVNKIEEYVDLNKKKAKERFVNEYIVKLRTENPQLDYSYAQERARVKLADIIRKNNKRIENHKKGD